MRKSRKTNAAACRDEITIAFGNAIRQRRLAIGMTQEELADAARVHRNCIGDVERGARNVALRNIQKLTRALGMSIAEFFTEYRIEG